MSDEAAVSGQKDQNRRLWRSVVFALVLLIEGSLIVLLFREATPELVVAVVVVAGLLVFSPRLFDFAGFNIGPGGLEATLNSIEERVEKQDRDIGELFAMAMGGPMYGNLKRIHDGAFPYQWSDGLQRELYYLRDVGYIQVDGGIRNIPKSGANLCDHVKITDHGRNFVRLRERYEKRIPQ